MRVAVIGADRPWGALLAAGLGAGFEVVALGAEDTSDLAGYRQVDLLQREALDPVLADVEAIVHAAGGDSGRRRRRGSARLGGAGYLRGADGGLCRWH